ncbi:MAG TPA: hypothetical protein VFM18_08380 [Methanosarcina sp.]|nr:hypothetical protein [Methanosarcina sp.]
MSTKPWFLICLLINEFPTKQGTYFGIDALAIHVSSITSKGRSFPGKDNHDLTHKNLIYHKMVIGACPEERPSYREEKCSFIRSEEADF